LIKPKDIKGNKKPRGKKRITIKPVLQITPILLPLKEKKRRGNASPLVKYVLETI
jgi:hypothetical protein